MSISRGSAEGRVASAVLALLLLVGALFATNVALITLFYFDFPGWSEDRATIAVQLGLYAAPWILIAAAALAVRAAIRFSIVRLLSALVPAGLLIGYLAITHIAFAMTCTKEFGFGCT